MKKIIIDLKDIIVILAKHDPVGVIFESNRDEYEPEAKSIIKRIPEMVDESSVQKIVHEEFVRWFDNDIAGSIDKYSRVASDIWQYIQIKNSFKS